MRARLQQSYPNKLVLRYVLSLIIFICSAIVSSVLLPATAKAAELTNRSVTLGSAIASATDSYNFNFTVQSTSNLGSIAFDFCSNSPILSEPCIPPAGLDVSAATLASQSGNIGFSVDGVDTTTNELALTRVPVAGIATNTNFVFDNITNPSAAGTTTFVRITTYATNNISGPYTDNGSVAYETATPFQIGAFVPPFLKLCAGVTVAPDCSSISGDRVDLGDLSKTQANAGTSQVAGGTNSPTGYAIYSLGNTMTSGNNFIPALASPTASFPGNSQFGINLRANLNPPVGQDPVGTGIATPTSNYNTPNRFMFSNGDSIAVASQPSDYNRLTISYLVNVPSGQPVGVYSTTITYEAVAQF